MVSYAFLYHASHCFVHRGFACRGLLPPVLLYRCIASDQTIDWKQACNQQLSQHSHSLPNHDVSQCSASSSYWPRSHTLPCDTGWARTGLVYKGWAGENRQMWRPAQTAAYSRVEPHAYQSNGSSDLGLGPQGGPTPVLGTAIGTAASAGRSLSSHPSSSARYRASGKCSSRACTRSCAQATPVVTSSHAGGTKTGGKDSHNLSSFPPWSGPRYTRVDRCRGRAGKYQRSEGSSTLLQCLPTLMQHLMLADKNRKALGHPTCARLPGLQ